MQDSLLWVYEGQTQFWGYVLGARSGMLSKQDTLDAIASTAAAYSLGTPGRAWRPLVDTTNDPIIAGRQPQPWLSWQRREDYYSEGQLIWLDVDRIIREQSAGKRSIDDFAKAFFGIRDRDWGEVTYNFDDIVATLNKVQPYDWRSYLQRRVYGVAPQAPLEGITQGGYKLVYTAEPTKWWKSGEKSRKATDLTYSGGLRRRQRRQGVERAVGQRGIQRRAHGRVAGRGGQRAQLRRRCPQGGDQGGRGGRSRAAASGPRRRRLSHRDARLAWRAALSEAGENRERSRNARRAARAALTWRVGQSRGRARSASLRRDRSRRKV